ncbi:MAG: GNAT family N-acetyltransferase [Oscillospiraceae bacterium]|nr:GNAT family N-acetyltransferase [Oscillospiraceae bacterium]
MKLHYKRAGLEDIDLLTETRIIVLRAANGLPDSADLSEVKAQSHDYYKHALADGSHIAYLVLDGKRFVGAGGVSLFQVMPTCCNPSGKKAYIMNMYTHPDYRRSGIARHTLDLLVKEVQSKGISAISLEATASGRPLYEAYGFVTMKDEMELPEKLP